MAPFRHVCMDRSGSRSKQGRRREPTWGQAGEEYSAQISPVILKTGSSPKIFDEPALPPNQVSTAATVYI